MWKFSILNDCYITRGILCVVQHCPRDPNGELWSKTCVGRCLIYDIVCVYCKSVYTSLFGMQQRLTTKLTYLIIACMYYVPKGGFSANNASFYKNKIGQLHNTLQFQLIVYAIVKITRRGTTVLLYEIAANSQKEHKLGVKFFLQK